MDDKTSNGRNYLSRGETIVNGILIPDVSGVYDIGTPTQRFKTIYADVEGNISDPDISVNNIRWPYIGPNDLRLYRADTKILFLDDNAGGNANLVVTGAITASTATITSATISSIASGGTNILDLLGSQLTLTPGATQAILRGRLTADTQFRLLLDLTNGLQLGPGGTTAPDVRLRRTAAGTLTLDNGAGTAGTLNTGTVTSGGALTLSTGVTGSLTISTAGGNIVMNAPSGNVQINRPITTASGDLTLNPAGTNITCSSKTLNTVGNLFTNNSTTAIGFPKIRVFSSGADIYGFGLQSNVLSYETVPVGSNHVFYVANTERIRINATALQLAVPITTGSGDLSLNPAGTNINCNGKTITNAVFSGSSLTSGPTNVTSGSWSGNLSVRFARTGNICVCTITGGVTATVLTNVWQNLSAIPTEFRPVENISSLCIDTNNALQLRFSVATGGTISIQKSPASNWAISDVLNVQMSISYIV